MENVVGSTFLFIGAGTVVLALVYMTGLRFLNRGKTDAQLDAERKARWKASPIRLYEARRYSFAQRLLELRQPKIEDPDLNWIARWQPKSVNRALSDRGIVTQELPKLKPVDIDERGRNFYTPQ